MIPPMAASPTAPNVLLPVNTAQATPPIAAPAAAFFWRVVKFEQPPKAKGKIR